MARDPGDPLRVQPVGDEGDGGEGYDPFEHRDGFSVNILNPKVVIFFRPSCRSSSLRTIPP
ncbi:hypothetical protein T190_22210 [Sinorhizobium meliloti CCBAU 01290]|nr:hypothetical protein T190_22210 [Sinorhizobium meliloti CCBAU 01290]